MGIIKTCNLEEFGVLNLSGPCSICGEKAIAYWQGKELIRVCRWCAIDILPKLIGDASVAGISQVAYCNTLNENWSCAKGEYYYAAALALENARKA